MHFPLALSETQAYALYPLIGLYVLLPAYAIVGGWPRGDDCRRVELSWLLMLPLGAFLGLWLAGNTIWTLFLWLWSGERHLDLASWFAGGFALLVSALLYIRLATGLVRRRYLHVNAGAAALCTALIGAMRFIAFADGIDGWTARGAAENSFAYLMKASEFYPADLSRRVIDETTPSLAAHGGKAYAIYIGDERASEIHVMPYYRWWWTVSYSRKFGFGGGTLSLKEQVQKVHEAAQKHRQKSGGGSD
jgi:hypothetical protein